MNAAAPWRAQLLQLLEVARLGSQFPDALKWRALLELLSREGPRGRTPTLACSEVSGLPLPKALAKLHKLQFVAREFLAQHRQRPLSDSRKFSMALAALELPPVSATKAKLVREGTPTRFLVVHERLLVNAVRFQLVLDQRSGKELKLDAAKQVTLSPGLQRALEEAGAGSASDVHRALSGHKGLDVVEVVRGQLGPFVSGLWSAPADLPMDVRALREAVTSPADAVLSVQLERLAADVAKSVLNDPWLGDELPVPGRQLARERRLFCTPSAEAAVKRLVTERGRPVLVRSR